MRVWETRSSSKVWVPEVVGEEGVVLECKEDGDGDGDENGDGV